MYVAQWLKTAESTLRLHDIDTPRLDALLFLEDTLKINRALLLAHDDKKITTVQLTKLNKLLNLRIQHKPMAHIRGHTEFYGHDFVITDSVLVPRPESEAMIELLKELISDWNKKENNTKSFQNKHAKLRIADIGSGSGALGISAKIDNPGCSVDLLEINNKALKVSQLNVDKFTLNISVIKSDLLQNAPTDYDILLCNLPYVPDEFPINKAAGWEPKMAIFGGSDGLNLYRNLFQQVQSLQKQPLYILTESFPSQQTTLSSIAQICEYELLKSHGFIQVFVST